MNKLLRLVLATLLLMGTCSVASFADGTEPPPCYPGAPNCKPPGGGIR